MSDAKMPGGPLDERHPIDSLPDPLFTVDGACRLTDANGSWCRVLDRRREELIGTPVHQYFAEPERAVTVFREIMESGGGTSSELSVLGPEGGLRLFSIHASVYRDPEGTVLGIVASARDITDERGLEQRLRSSQVYNRSLLEMLPDGLIVVDPELVVTDVNEESVRLSGFERTELLGRPLENIFRISLPAREALRRTLASGAPSDVALVLKPRRGTPIPVPVSVAMFRDPHGDVRGILSVAP